MAGENNGSADNRSVVLYGVEDLRIEETPMPGPPGNNEVLLRTIFVGLCGSDMHFWKEGHIGSYGVNGPVILGHETCAEVVSIGPNVTHLKPGDRVCVEPGLPCRYCQNCKLGAYNLCPSITIHGAHPTNGTLRKYFTHPADFTYKLPDNISNEEGAMIEPLTVAVYACRRAKVKVGDDVLVCGAGPIGLLNIMVAKAFGAKTVVVTDIYDERLRVAQEVGADSVLLVDRDETDKHLVRRVVAAFGRQPDITIECSGAESSLRLALLATRAGGRAVVVALGYADHVSLPIQDAMIREVQLIGALLSPHCFPPAISLVASGKVNLKRLVTHRFSFDDAVKAFNTAFSRDGIKVLIHVGE